ncbi:Ig-like domain-containing protein [Flavobacterium suzhouense]|uniref:T9SS type A sorting domain-containing protein n=1 Tax=Flavobacterium suzhouense TaxID=1529638 RepID=A0ABW5NU05_9FLAO
MKKLLLLTALLAGAAGAYAQSKATAVVTLTSGMTAKLELNNTTSTATLTFTGPSDRWFALQIGSFTNSGGMQNGTDVVYWNGTTLVDGNQNGLGSAPSADATNDWTSTNSVSGTTRTIIATRAFNTGSADDFTFVYSDINVDFAWAKGSSATNTLISHGTSRGYSLNNAYNCIAPSAPTATAQTFCAGATVVNLVATGEAGATFKWYAAATGGTALASTAVLTTGTTYYVSQTVGECESTRTAVAVTVTTVPLPQTADTTPDFCSASTIANLTVTGQAGATFTWYNEPNGGTVLPTTTALAGGTNYYVSQTVNGCTSARLMITPQFVPVPMPTASESQSFCSESHVSDLVATGQAGSTISWYDVATGGTPLAGTTLLVAGDYYVSQTVGSCVSERKHIVVSFTTLDAPSVPSETATTCTGSTITSLTVTGLSGATFTWYENETGGNAIPTSTVLVDGEDYYVTQTVGECVSGRRKVIINIDELPIPVAEENQSICAGSEVEDIEAEGLAGAVLTWYTTPDGPALDEEAVVEAGTYYVKQTLNGCTSGAKEVNVTILPAPSIPGGNAVQEFEAGATVSDLEITVAVGAEIQWYVMDGDELEEIGSDHLLQDGVTYYVTQTIEGCESEPLAITVEQVLGSPTFTLKNLVVYPNPVVDKLTISYSEPITEISVINMLGQVVMSKKVNTDKVELNTEKLQNGSYILRVATAQGIASIKVVK